MSEPKKASRKPAAKRVEAKRVGGTRITGFGLSIQARPGAVVFVADGIQLELSPEQARELSRDLAECADDAGQHDVLVLSALRRLRNAQSSVECEMGGAS